MFTFNSDDASLLHQYNADIRDVGLSPNKWVVGAERSSRGVDGPWSNSDFMKLLWDANSNNSSG